ncbi:MAG: sulfatase-like hydrolase/transferase, partial [Planctomycetota bacterium]
MNRRFVACLASTFVWCGQTEVDATPGAAGDLPPNVLLICIDDLRPELGCYGVEYIRSPHIDQLAARGCLFRRHYVQAPTCGASRFALLTGR